MLRSVAQSLEQTQNINIENTMPLVPPREMKNRIEMSSEANATVVRGRKEVVDILNGKDSRLLAVVGPCSIHDEDLALDYARRLREIAAQVSDRILVVMRVYFEKPRTTLGWKGLINDPNLNGTFDMDKGLTLARKILCGINELGLPCGSEMLDPITPQYTADLVTWASIGARTIESQTHRQMASGLSMPVGFKNGTDGNLQMAIDAMVAGQSPHAFLGINETGLTCVVNTKGNPWGHLILRGGFSGPNYDRENLAVAAERLEKAKCSSRLVVDCSHANSNKDYTRQPAVFDDVLEQRLEGNKNIIGVMLESNIQEGKQSIPDNLADLKYGVSLTDGCIGIDQTEELLKSAYEKL